MMTRVLFSFLLMCLFTGIYSCNTEHDSIEPGSICTVRNGAGQFRLVKVLSFTTDKVQLIVFKNVYPERPAAIGPGDLELDNAEAEAQQEHSNRMEMARAQFEDLQPVVVAFEKVVQGDLEVR